ncbi:MAG TPA: hypothetical protein VMV72_02360 [Verrucomicrobiae bacterium]|nr:hypothetical protein [Verrucomicrobiae bacterium]
MTTKVRLDNLLPATMKRHANWLAWFMQGVLGLFVGALAGFVVVTGRHGSSLVDDNLILPFMVGGALVGAGLASRYGDGLWFSDNYCEIPPDEPEQSNLSDILSWCLVAAGVATCVVTILRQFRVL